MKINPKKAALIGLAATTLFSVSGCGTNGNADASSTPESVEATEPPATVDPALNEAEAVYGPPEVFEEDDNGDEPETPEEIDPADNENEEVYGPPEFFE